MLRLTCGNHTRPNKDCGRCKHTYLPHRLFTDQADAPSVGRKDDVIVLSTGRLWSSRAAFMC